LRGGFGIFRRAPPLTIETSELDLGLEIFDKAPVQGPALTGGYVVFAFESGP